VVKTNSEKFIVKVGKIQPKHRSNKFQEMKLLSFLNSQKVPVNRPIPRIDQKFVGFYRDNEEYKYIILLQHSYGKEKEFHISLEQSYIAGKSLAQLHQALQMYHGEYDTNQVVWDESLIFSDEFCKIVKSYFNSKTQEIKDLLNSSTSLCIKYLQSLSRENKVFGLIHGDYYSLNIHFDDNNRVTILDFEALGYGWFIYDISSFLTSYSLFGDIKKNRIMISFLDGYQSIRKLASEEIEAIPYLIIARNYFALYWMISRYNESDNNPEIIEEYEEFIDRILEEIRSNYFQILNEQSIN
jgi:Ser/Thr protein kinase RdoA (MazF antagonist)